MSVRKLLATLAVVCSAALFVPFVAGASASTGSTTNSFTHLVATGKAKNGKKFTGTYTIQKFVVKHGKPEALGTLTGHLGQKKVSVTNVAAPVSLVKSNSSSSTSQVNPDQATACPILHLTLGPLNLNLLGLQVQIPNPVILNVNAIPGAGNLLGNLLCDVANLLNTSPTAAQTSALLNVVNSLLANLSGLLSGL